MSDDKEMIKLGSEMRFMLVITAHDPFISVDDMLDFIAYRLNLKYAVNIKELYLIDKKPLEVRNEKCDAA